MSKKAIIDLWINCIISGRKTYSQVPGRLKKNIRELLVETGRQDLISEEE